MKNIVPAGKHRGRDLAELTKQEVHAIWSGWNGSDKLRRHPFFEAIEARKDEVDGKKRREPTHKPHPSQSGVMYFGKYNGTHVREVPTDYLDWLIENDRCGRLREIIVDEVSSRRNGARPVTVQRVQPKLQKPKRKPTSLAATHYAWTDPTGRVCMIPNEISMEGRENEECPFDMPEPEPYREEVTDLDREFRAICGL